jgi:serine/threonine protein kinase
VWLWLQVKAENFLIFPPFGNIKIADFNSARKFDEPCEKEVTPYVCSPELAKFICSETEEEEEIQMMVSGKADIWALGVTALYLVSGEPPFLVGDGDDLPSQLAPIARLQQSDVDAAVQKARTGGEFESFLQACLQLDPDKRLSAQELLGKGYLGTNKATQSMRDGGAAVRKVSDKLDGIQEAVEDVKEGVDDLQVRRDPPLTRSQSVRVSHDQAYRTLCCAVV